MKPVAIFLYELSGRAAEPFLAAGWDCYCIDLQHPKTRSIGNLHLVRADARSWKPSRDMIARCRFFAAFPPCDDLACSGALWFKGKGLRALSGAIELFAVAAEWAEFFEVAYFIENPRSTISTYWRKPDHTFDPCDYSAFEPAEHFTKKTCLWTGGGFVMPPRAALPGPATANVIRDMPGKGKARANARSVTPRGFMRAVFEANLAVEIVQ